jgi:PilZ domain
VNNNNPVKAEERRQFFRVDDEVNLIYRKIDENQVMQSNSSSENVLGNCSLSNALDALSQESAVLLYRLEKTHPDISACLSLIDKKIALIAQAIAIQSSQFSNNNNRNANLSATGIAFDSQDAFQDGDFLEIKILLVGSMSVIVACGKIVYCKQNPGNASYPYVIGVDYVSIKDQDRELLIKHVVKRQLQQIRDKKENK